jgi:tape measure domain-containing protein
MAETKFFIRVIDGATASIKKIDSSFSSMTRGFSTATRALTSFQTAFGFFTSGLLVRQFTQFSVGFMEAADRFERMQLKFKAIGAPDYTKDVIAFARKNPVMDIKDVQDAFVKLYAVGINPTSKALQSLADASAAFGLTGQDVNKVLLAIGQISGKQVVNMEELRQQLGERIASAVEIMSTKLGYGTDKMREFFKAVEQGRISAREGLTALFEGFT